MACSRPGRSCNETSFRMTALPRSTVALAISASLAQPRRISTKKNGTPISAVTMPMGKMAPGRMVLDNTDDADSKHAPHNMDSGM